MLSRHGQSSWQSKILKVEICAFVNKNKNKTITSFSLLDFVQKIILMNIRLFIQILFFEMHVNVKSTRKARYIYQMLKLMGFPEESTPGQTATECVHLFQLTTANNILLGSEFFTSYTQFTIKSRQVQRFHTSNRINKTIHRTQFA